MRTAVMTDTNSGLLEAEARKHGIFIVPMPVIVDGNVFFEGENIDSDTFFEALYSDKDISTSQPSPADVTDRWDAVFAMGYDEIVYIPMASGLSESCSTAKFLAEEYGGRVQVVDNNCISVTLWGAALTAKRLIKKGWSALKIKDYLEKTADDSLIYIAVDTLHFLKKGGRISPSAAAIGEILNIKPILALKRGKLGSLAKVRSIKKAMPMMIKSLKQHIEKHFQNDTDNCIIATAGAGLSKGEIHGYLSQLQAAFPNHDVKYYPLPLSICTHTGKGAIGTGIIYNRPDIA